MRLKNAAFRRWILKIAQLNKDLYELYAKYLKEYDFDVHGAVEGMLKDPIFQNMNITVTKDVISRMVGHVSINSNTEKPILISVPSAILDNKRFVTMYRSITGDNKYHLPEGTNLREAYTREMDSFNDISGSIFETAKTVNRLVDILYIEINRVILRSYYVNYILKSRPKVEQYVRETGHEKDVKSLGPAVGTIKQRPVEPLRQIQAAKMACNVVSRYLESYSRR